jgi:hypothetical protein
LAPTNTPRLPCPHPPPACRYGELTEVILGGGEDGGELFCFAQYK